MDFIIKIKSCFQKAVIKTINTELSAFEIIFEGAVDSVFVTLEEDDRFKVSYPILKQDYKMNLKLSTQTSERVLLAGVIWILEQVEKNGKVMPEF